MLNLIKMYSNLPLIPKDRFFRIRDIAVLNPKKDQILTQGMFNRYCPQQYPDKCSPQVLVSPVMILSSYQNIFRIPYEDWVRFDKINQEEELSFPIFVDTNEDWIAKLER